MSKEKILEPSEEEIELYDKKYYDAFLDKVYGSFTIGVCTFNSSRILSELDPIAYNCGMSDIQEYEIKYYCPICGAECCNYDEAKWCCQEESDDDNED